VDEHSVQFVVFASRSDRHFKFPFSNRTYVCSKREQIKVQKWLSSLYRDDHRRRDLYNLSYSVLGGETFSHSNMDFTTFLG
jgi:hypothetical protein